MDSLALGVCVVALALATSTTTCYAAPNTARGSVRIHDVPHPTSPYKAAVIEYDPEYEYDKVVTVDYAKRLMQRNLERIGELVVKAATDGAQVVVLPEDGLYGFLNCKREEIRPYLFGIPSPGEAAAGDPCSNVTAPTLLSNLSCLAKKNSIVLVADVGELVPCDTRTDSECPEDNAYQYNTALAFNETGAVIAKYRKFHLFYEKQFNQAEMIPVSFTTSFGVKFGLMVCFDVMFSHPLLDLIEGQGITDLVLSSWWVNTPPSFSATQWYQAISRRFNITVLAAGGLQRPAWKFSGSGIFSRGAPLASFYNTGTATSAHLLYSGSASYEQQVGGIAAPHHAGDLLRADPTSCKDGPSPPLECPEGSTNFHSFVAAPGSQGTLTSTCGEFSCTAYYSVSSEAARGPPVAYALFVFAGWYQGFYQEQNCMFYKCYAYNDCLTETMETDTVFEHVRLEGNYDDAYDMFVLAAGHDGDVLPKGAVALEGKSSYIANHDSPLLNLALLGLKYNRTGTH
eukprot:m.36877 g.36877  ORF g.36877 m.36877 type:complete len:513 (+) comp11056_c0_seq3:81-1619(+)